MQTRALLACACFVALVAVHCSSSPSAGVAGGDGGSGSSGGGGSSGGSSGGASSGGGSSGGGSHDAGTNLDAWAAPDVGAPVEAGNPGQVDITFTVTAAANVQPISPYIYGVNDVGQVAAVKATIARMGGNRMTAFNWENNASNAGSDYQFENDDFLCSGVKCVPTNDTPGAYLKANIDTAAAANAAMIVTVPIVDYVSADKSPGGDVRSSGSNYLQTRFKQNKAAKGAAFAYPPDTTDGFVYQDEMANWLVKTGEPNATIRFQLDNEPDLWSSTHAEVHPTPVTYAELAQRNIAYATALKKAVPGAFVIGPVNYGWAGYVTLQNATDSQADGDFVSWWLGQMSAASMSAGERLIDGLDLHWYPEATGGGARITDNGTSAAEVAAREQAPRSLWDATYVETSWITQSIGNAAINLIPRMMQKIQTNYPGTKLSFTEWNYGGGTDISGAIASADVLGIFGVYGVDMATMWPLNGNEAFTYAAFKAFRNYDGNGAAFGDTSVKATTTDPVLSSVYASLASTDASKLVVVAINKDPASKVAGVVIAHSTVYTKASVYTVTAAGGANVVPGTALTSVGTNAFKCPLPAQSITVIVPAP